MEFLSTSLKIQKELGMSHRSKNGVFFTPKSLRELLLRHVDIQPETILEPSCGSGEFIVDCEKMFPNAAITGIEINEKLVSIAKENASKSNIHTMDFMHYEGGKFDLVIGNPPFVQIKSVNKKATKGRSNLYLEILYKCLMQHLKEHGILAMVLPSTIMNGEFSKNVREIILSKQIVHFEVFRDHNFKDTKAGVCIIVIRNVPSSNIEYNFEGFITSDAHELRLLSSDCKRLKDFDVTIKYGMMTKPLKDSFSRDPTHVPFVLKHDLRMNEICFDENRLFINKEMKTHSGKCVLILRSNDVVMGSEYELKFSMFESNSFLFDLCLIGIFGDDIDKIYDSLCDPRTKTYLKKICGSGRLTKQLLLNLPIFQN